MVSHSCVAETLGRKSASLFSWWFFEDGIEVNTAAIGSSPVYQPDFGNLSPAFVRSCPGFKMWCPLAI